LYIPLLPDASSSRLKEYPFEVAKEALRLGSQKFPITTKFVVRRDYHEE
jgi:large subunit ribosomal protein L16